MSNTHVCVSWIVRSTRRDPSLSRACYTYSLTFAFHGRIGLNASLFSRERLWYRARVDARLPVVLLFTGASIFARVAFFASSSSGHPETSLARGNRCPVLFRETQNAREDEGIIIYIAVKPEFCWALSSGLNETNPYDVQVDTRLSFHSQRRLFAPIRGDG